MTTQALYNRWRGQTFDDILGQEHSTRTSRCQMMGVGLPDGQGLPVGSIAHAPKPKGSRPGRCQADDPGQSGRALPGLCHNNPFRARRAMRTRVRRLNTL